MSPVTTPGRPLTPSGARSIRQHQDGHLAPLGAQQAAQVQPVQPGQRQIQDHEAPFELQGQAQPFFAAAGDPHDEPRGGQAPPQEIRHGRVILDDQ